ncbi:MAG: type IV toxin-antitoxin system AbiEi family antitoxin domain-containing protein [Micromonosporaceae bacterium]|nr:type IV toxin-antitoxin system AbiEi family antitoxin domain-containing protein [Micromonosporaceae bacterium]
MLDELLATQDGIVARQQALAAGVSAAGIRARLDSGAWQRLLPGVYAGFSGPVPRPAWLWAVLLWAGPGAVLSHETAAELHGLLDKSCSVDRPGSFDQPGSEVHVTIPWSRTLTPSRGIVVHRRRSMAGIAVPGRQPPRTRVEETIVDLTQTATSLEEAYAWIARAVNARLTTVDRISIVLRRRSRVRWRRELAEGLGDVAAGCRSVLEMAYRRDVEVAHGLPTAHRQFAITRGGGKNYIDVRYGRYATRVELDGLAAHPPHRRFRDMRRDNDAVVAGEATLRYGTADVVGAPCRVAAQVVAVLRRNGWRGAPRRCRRPACPLPDAS